MIELSHVTKSFQTDQGTITAANDVCLKVNKGDIYGIIGLSGAGKSTLVRCINYLEVPTSGDVIYNGTALGSLSKKGAKGKKKGIPRV